MARAFAASKLVVLALLLTGCAKPPDVREISDECAQATGLSGELRNQAGKLFKNYDRANAMAKQIRENGCENVQSVGQIVSYNHGALLRAGCVNGYLFVYDPVNGGVVQVFKTGQEVVRCE